MYFSAPLTYRSISLTKFEREKFSAKSIKYYDPKFIRRKVSIKLIKFPLVPYMIVVDCLFENVKIVEILV